MLGQVIIGLNLKKKLLKYKAYLHKMEQEI